MRIQIHLLAALLACVVIGTGCFAKSVSRVDANWGSAQRDNASAMIANPEGSPADHDPGAQTDGRTAENAMKRHRTKQCKKKDAEPQSIINIGTVGK